VLSPTSIIETKEGSSKPFKLEQRFGSFIIFGGFATFVGDFTPPKLHNHGITLSNDVISYVLIVKTCNLIDKVWHACSVKLGLQW